MVLRAKEPNRAAISSCAEPKTRRKSFAINLPSLLAAIAVIVFTDRLQDRKMLSFSKKTGSQKTPRGRRPEKALGIEIPATLLARRRWRPSHWQTSLR